MDISRARRTSAPRPVLAAAFVAWLLLGPGQAATAQQTVTLAGDPFPPYVLGKLGESASSGIAVDLIHAIFLRLDDVNVSFPLIPWKRALREVEVGTKDGIPILLKTRAREAYMVYTSPLLTSDSLVWYSKRAFPDGLEWSELSDLNAYRVGIKRGYSYGDTIDGAIEDGTLRVTAVPSVGQLFTMLVKRRVDVVVANHAVGSALARRHAGEGPIVAAVKPIGLDVYYMGFSKQSPARQLVPRIDRALAEIKADGTFARIVSRSRHAHASE